jgi:acyl carrier protein
MNRSEMMTYLEELLERPKGSLTGEESLAAISSWDSVAVVGFIALIDEKFGFRVPGKQITDCRTVNELLGLLGEHIGAG